MPAYRMYRVDGAGKFLTAEWLEAANDESAIAAAQAASADEACELWQQQRLVARVHRDGSISIDPR